MIYAIPFALYVFWNLFDIVTDQVDLFEERATQMTLFIIKIFSNLTFIPVIQKQKLYGLIPALAALEAGLIMLLMANILEIKNEYPFKYEMTYSVFFLIANFWYCKVTLENRLNFLGLYFILHVITSLFIVVGIIIQIAKKS